MDQQLAATKRVTLYRMVEGTAVGNALKDERYESGEYFESIPLEVEGLRAHLAFGSVSNRSKWANDVALLTGHKVDLRNQLPGAVLVLQDLKENVWAITWGVGFQFLDGERVDFGFGSKILARSAMPDEIKSLTKTILDHRARVDRSSVPTGSSIRDLGVDGYGEVVSKIEAKGTIAGLAVGDGPIQLRAADSLNLPLAKQATKLVADLKTLDELLEKPVLPGLENVEQLVALKPRDSKVSELETRLFEALKSGSETLGMGWPHERLETYGPVASCKVLGFGDHHARTFEDPPAISDVLTWFEDVPLSQVDERSKSIRLELHSEVEPAAGTQVSKSVSLRRWLTFEVREGSERYCLHNGSWYRMDDRYLERIDRRVTEILAGTTDVTLPPWPEGEYERDYNVRVAPLIGGYRLDRKLISTPLHARGGIEPCDIYVDPGILIHVKRGTSSAELSHLMAQALVSTESLSRDENARAAWQARMLGDSNGAISNAGIREVVLGIGRANPVTVDSLFTFSKVNLVRQYDALKFLGVDVAVITIPES